MPGRCLPHRPGYGGGRPVRTFGEGITGQGNDGGDNPRSQVWVAARSVVGLARHAVAPAAPGGSIGP